MKKKAFTLVELLIVVVIIGILATIVTLALSSYSARAKDVKAKTAIEEVQKMVQILAADEVAFPAECATGRAVSILSGGASASGCTAGKLKLTSQPLDAQGQAIRLQYTSEVDYKISGKNAKNDACWYVTPTTKEGLTTASSTQCL